MYLLVMQGGWISIHALREEGDVSRGGTGAATATISIHALREEGDSCYKPGCHQGTYFYPRPPRGGRRRRLSVWSLPAVISIHALREEGDVPALVDALAVLRISIHALREEGDLCAALFHTFDG